MLLGCPESGTRVPDTGHTAYVDAESSDFPPSLLGDRETTLNRSGRCGLICRSSRRIATFRRATSRTTRFGPVLPTTSYHAPKRMMWSPWPVTRAQPRLRFMTHPPPQLVLPGTVVGHLPVWTSKLAGHPTEFCDLSNMSRTWPNPSSVGSRSLRRTYVAGADALPKTRSGKIMRRLLRDVAAGKGEVGDTTTLEDYGVLAKVRESEKG